MAAPFAVKGTDAPAQIVELAGVTFIIRAGTTVIVTVVSAVQVPLVPVTVYVVVDAGAALTVAPVVELRPAADVHT